MRVQFHVAVLVRVSALALAAGVLPPLPPTYAQSLAPAFQAPIAVQTIHNRLVVGLRYTHVTLTDDTRSAEDSYLGHITELDAGQDTALLHWIYLQWWLPSRTPAGLGAELSWVRVDAATINDTGAYSDGDVRVGGPAATLVGRFPIDLESSGVEWTLTPRFGVGAALLSSDFHHTAWWHYGFSPDTESENPAAAPQAAYDGWVARGADAAEITSTRTIALDDTVGVILTGALAASYRNWSAELCLRYMPIDVPGLYTQTHADGTATTRAADFVLDHWAWGIGVAYAF